MKNLFNIFLSFAIIGFVFSTETKPNPLELQGTIENLINGTIKGIVDTIPEPVIVENLNFTIPENLTISGDVRVKDLEISGLNKLVATQIAVKILSLEANTTLVIPELTISLNYDLDVLIAEIVPIYGNGPVTIKLENIQIIVDGKLKLGKAFTVSDIKADITLDSAHFNIEGILDNEALSSLISTALNDNFADFIDTYQEAISRIISPLLEDLINSVIPGELSTDTQDLQIKLNQYNSLN